MTVLAAAAAHHHTAWASPALGFAILAGLVRWWLAARGSRR